jgi:DNA-binding CsgD family transcriptional regulator
MAAAGRHVRWQGFVGPNCRTHYGAILVATGHWEEAERQLLIALEEFGAGYRGAQPMAVVRLAELRIRQGRLEEAERLLEDADWHPAARRILAGVALARRELQTAEELARLCFESQDLEAPGCAPLLELTAQVQLQRADLPAARGTLERLHAIAAATQSERAEAGATLVTGLVAAAEGDTRAAAHLQEAVERFARLELPLEGARARLELARVTRSATEAAGALRTFERLGARLDADAAAALLRELGAPGRAWPRVHGELTKREQEVLALLGEGLSNAAIAERLVISRRTAEHHVASVLAKLGLHSRAEAAAHAVREGQRPVAG